MNLPPACTGDTLYRREQRFGVLVDAVRCGATEHLAQDSRGVWIEVRRVEGGFKLYVTDLRDHKDYDGQQVYETESAAMEAIPAAVSHCLAQRANADAYACVTESLTTEDRCGEDPSKPRGMTPKTGVGTGERDCAGYRPCGDRAEEVPASGQQPQSGQRHPATRYRTGPARTTT